MNTPAHLVLSAVVLGRGRWQGLWWPITAGAVTPDSPMFGFYLYERLARGTPERVIWSDVYFQTDWQFFFDLFNSFPLLGIAAFLSWRAKAPRALAFFASMILHCLADLPLHHDDAHGHFEPLSSWRFASPISYWDPAHYGRIVGALELLGVVVGAGSLVWRSPVKAWRAVGAATLVSYGVFIAFALLVWL